jgi:crossover junction endodeoxyribonuclease RuvC
VHYGCVETSSTETHAARLLAIYRALDRVINEYNPSLSAIETLYFGRNVSSAISVAEARGVIQVCLALHNIPISEFRPNQIKQAVTGIQTADKAQVQQMVALLLGLDKVPKPDHAADALAAAITASFNK